MCREGGLDRGPQNFGSMTQLRFASFVLYGVLGPPVLVFFLDPEATHKARLRALEGCRMSKSFKARDQDKGDVGRNGRE